MNKNPNLITQTKKEIKEEQDKNRDILKKRCIKTLLLLIDSLKKQISSKMEQVDKLNKQIALLEK